MSGQIVISDIVPDADTGRFVRLVQIYDAVPADPSVRPILELLLYADQNAGKGPLQIAVPGGLQV
jgi:hypothetical protein